MTLDYLKFILFGAYHMNLITNNRNNQLRIHENYQIRIDELLKKIGKIN